MHHPRTTTRLPRPLVAAAALLAALPLGGCYTWEPPVPPAPVAGQEVRVQLTGAGRDRLMARRALDMGSLEGIWVEGDVQELAVQVRLDANRLGFGSRDVVDTLRIPRADVRDLGVKRMSVTRSVLAAAAGVAAVGGLYAAFGSGEGGEGSDDGGEVFIRLPLAGLLGGVAKALGGG